ncbi:hypothetical protein [Hazenella coriacea]|uniref:Heat induced stress protein YflT n=1 Tax=Hazenella coriacea TaxID=1179467 RepID=A0A4R3L2K8_9BACL|nr:hypothetical protein [Hazenella coriacea]TCS93432.1 hypothetical protein EDD58_10779 [Hazenella coriacea]
MKEKNIFSYFHTMEEAQKAANELKKRGFKTVEVDRVAPPLGGNPLDGDPEINGLLFHEANSLTTTTMGTPDDFSRNQTILAASHPDASGYTGGNGLEHPEDVSVIVICSEEKFEEATQLLKQHGARL